MYVKKNYIILITNKVHGIKIQLIYWRYCWAMEYAVPDTNHTQLSNSTMARLHTNYIKGCIGSVSLYQSYDDSLYCFSKCCISVHISVKLNWSQWKSYEQIIKTSCQYFIIIRDVGIHMPFNWQSPTYWPASRMLYHWWIHTIKLSPHNISGATQYWYFTICSWLLMMICCLWNARASTTMHINLPVYEQSVMNAPSRLYRKYK